MDLLTYMLLPAIAFLAAGTVKGAVGLGLPTTALGIMTLSIDPRAAIALIMVPMITSNAWQAYRSGEVLRALRTYLPFALTLAFFVGLTVMLTREAPDRLLFAMLGGAILIFVAVNITRWAPYVPNRYDKAAQVVAGVISGLMGGMTSVWAPPMAVYLASRGVNKAEFVRATGVMIFIGSLPLAAGYVAQGYLTLQTGVISVALLAPTFAGFALGEAIRHRLSEKAFRRMLLFVFFLMGLNLLRRALF